MPKKKQKVSGKVSIRLKQIREHFRFTRIRMATKMGIVPTAYYKNEQGLTVPGIPALQALHDNLGISIDWLLFGTGSMLLETGTPEPPQPDCVTLWDEKIPGVRQLLEHMEREPGLRHKILAFYHNSQEGSGGEK